MDLEQREAAPTVVVEGRRARNVHVGVCVRGGVRVDMHDIQSLPDHRNVALDQVGVTDLRYPITVYDRAKKEQQTVARITMSVNLPHHFKGTHMSRFIEVIEAHQGLVTMKTLPGILRELKRTLEAESARMEVRFPYFIERSAPVSH